MLFLFVVFTTGCLSLLALGLVEQRRHYANLRRIPTRVLINGIRGKSSITRLCAGALRGGGLVTVAKTTGTAARFIHPDGSEEPVYRKFGIANVVEQIGIVRRASAYQPDVLAIECMAVQPDLQEINQSKLIQSTIGVLCNVREDHLAEMGPTLDDVARSLSRSMPVGGVCVTAEQERLHILREEAARRKCSLVSVDPSSVTDEQMAGFSWITFKENVAIALAVADLLGVNRQSALAGMWAAAPDPGVLSVQRYQVDSLNLRFANIFAANDPESTLMNITQLLDSRAISHPLHVVINCRPDRIERNGQMGALIPQIAPVRVVLIGEATRSARTAIPPTWSGQIVDLGGRLAPATLLAGVLDGMTDSASLVTIGNIHGQGEILLSQLATLPPAEPQQVSDLEAVNASQPISPHSSQPQTATGLHPVGSPSPEPRTSTGLQPTPEPPHANNDQPGSADPRTASGFHPVPEPHPTTGPRPAGSLSPESLTGTGLQPATEPWPINESRPESEAEDFPTSVGLEPVGPWPVKAKSPQHPKPDPKPKPGKRFRPSPVPRRKPAHDTAPIPRIPGDPRSDP